MKDEAGSQIQSNYQIFNINGNHVTNGELELEIKENGFCVARVCKEDEEEIVYKNHIGDQESIKLLLNSMINNSKTTKTAHLIKNYLGLIESSFKYLLKKDNELIESVDLGLFETVRIYLRTFFK